MTRLGHRACRSPAGGESHDTARRHGAGDLSFSGYNWLRRTWPGAPHYNGQWSGDNVVLNGDGTVTPRLTNPGGSAVAAELLSTRTGWGYGSYSLDFRADFDVVS